MLRIEHDESRTRWEISPTLWMRVFDTENETIIVARQVTIEEVQALIRNLLG